jgi:hydrogenase nickel incorporation protein HypA/HybF
MHELAIANRIVDRAREAAAAHDADRVTELTLEVGTATHLNPDQLRFCLETVADGTPAADATVHIETVTPRGECDCGWNGEPPTLDGVGAVIPTLACPACGDRLTLTAGRECRLAAVTVPDGTTVDDAAPAGPRDHDQSTAATERPPETETDSHVPVSDTPSRD